MWNVEREASVVLLVAWSSTDIYKGVTVPCC